MTKLHAVVPKINHVSSGLRPDEAAAVLSELQRQAEHRLLDASLEFQDIAFEMEWRMTDWQAMIDQRDALLTQGGRIMAPISKFNVAARKRTGKVPQQAAWYRLARSRRRKLEALEMRIAECAAAIMTRNEEGRYLEQEIELLQGRVTRISSVLNEGTQRRARVVRNENETAEALARLALELSLEPDVADLDVLISAFQAFESRRNLNNGTTG